MNNNENNDALKPPKRGAIAEGKIIGMGKSSVFIDLGAWGTGIIYGKDFLEAKETLKKSKIGDKIIAKITELDNEDGYVELSLRGASQELAWKELIQKREGQEILTIKVLGANRGGLLTKVSGITAFLPVSQLSPGHYPKVKEGDTTKILNELRQFIGKELKVRIIDLDPRQEKIILSEKTKIVKNSQQTLKNYKPGDMVEGKVTGVTDFGAFISFPASADAPLEENSQMEGLIHISELSEKPVNHPSEVVQVNQNIKARIIKIDDNKVYLSLKNLKEPSGTKKIKKEAKPETKTEKV